jgi:phosphotransferase system enzyme I (PtsI)
MMRILKGIPTLGRIVAGEAFVYSRPVLTIPRYEVEGDEDTISKELARLNTALGAVKTDLLELGKTLQDEAPSAGPGYIDAAILALGDPTVTERVNSRIREERLNVEWIYNEVMKEIVETIGKSGSEYMKERAPDVAMITHRVMRHLVQNKGSALPETMEKSVVIAHALSPGEAVSFYRKKAKALVTETGGRTSHLAIISRGLKLTAVLGASGAVESVKAGDQVIVDGMDGIVVVNPEAKTLAQYARREKKRAEMEEPLTRARFTPCALREGVRVSLLANIEVEEQLETAKDSGCEGVGLFRTEYAFMNAEYPPTEEEQYGTYKRVAEAMSPLETTIRVIDLGGDKTPPYMSFRDERNPFLGLRGLRYALAHREILRTQLRAILRASSNGNVRILIPMVSDLDEVASVRKIIAECAAELPAHCPERGALLPVGAMVETPSSVFLIDRIAEHVDFLSVGTNDLIQYTLAVDRVNEGVAGEYELVQPSILRCLKLIADGAKEKGVEVSVCGEIAGSPLYALLLVGFGYRKLSMSPTIIPPMRSVIADSSLEEAERLACHALTYSSKHELTKFVRDYTSDRFGRLERFFPEPFTHDPRVKA